MVNNTEKGKSVLSTLVEEIESCKTFLFSVAFIAESGLATLKSHLLDLKLKGIKSRIITSTYLYFNQPKVFKELLKLTNVEVKISSLEGFHSKGYIFKHENHYSLIVGSSNLTAHALKVNYEWNVKLTSHKNGEIINHFRKQFEHMWEQSKLLSKDWISAYEKEYEKADRAQQTTKIRDSNSSYDINLLKEALELSLIECRKLHYKK